MAYSCPRDLDGFMGFLPNPDMKFRQQVGGDLLEYLAEPSNSIACQDIGQVIDGLIPWMQSSNYKVSSIGIEVMTELVNRLGHDFRPYIQTVLPAVVDRLGDAKDAVREKAQLLLLKILEREVLTPQHLLEKLTPSFSHRNAKIREEVLRCLLNTLNEHGTQSVTLNKFIPHIVKLLSDPTSTVRDTALSTLVDLYKHVGDKLRMDIQKRNLVPAAKLPGLLARFDEAKSAGELLPTASSNIDYLMCDEIDRAVMAKPAVPVKRAGLTAAKRTPSAASRLQTTPAGPQHSAVMSRVGSLRKVNTASGAVDEDTFCRSFEDVPTVQLFSQREVNDHMKGIQDTISDSSKDWNKRVDSLQKIRSLIIAGAADFDDFYMHIKALEFPLQESIKDLRSQVVRETCITIAYLAQTLTNTFERSAENLLNTLINLIQNSAKIIATSGTTCIKFIIQYCQSPRLIPIITQNLCNSKSKDIRRSCCEFLEYMLTQWSRHSLERHIPTLQEALKKGVADADPDARVSSRKAFRGFRDHFPEQAENLLQSLEPSYRRALQGELCLSSSSSSGSLAQAVGGLRAARQYKPPTQSTDSAKKGLRSNSAIDLQAVQRAKARAQYAAMARHKVTSGTASLPRPRKSPDVPTSMQTPEQTGRRRSRSTGVSHSQPTSRSGSPSARLPYLYNRGNDSDSPRPRRLSSGIPRSTTGSRDTSREGSPTRTPSMSRYIRVNDRPPISPAARPVMAQKILQQSREAENALADALTFDQMDAGDHHKVKEYLSRKGMRSLENHSDDSETSSVCSERSFDSFRRPSDSFSWSGSQQRLSSRDIWEPCRDISEIIALCASTTWQERKDGLVSLRYYVNMGSQLSPGELKHITEIFTKMFMDSHTKGVSVFLDTLNEIIKRYKNDLHDWLYVLLHRIFHKMGIDLLNSTHNKLLNTLENIKKCFPVSSQLNAVYRFFVDATQTPNAKTKAAALNYLASLYHMADNNQFVTKPPANQALQKIIIFSQDMKSAEIRNAARMCLIALWNCNTSQMTMMLAELSKEHQEIASSIVQSHMRKCSTGSEPGSPLIGSSPKALSPGTPTKHVDFSQEEIYKSLRKTTAEIQNYSYETLGTKLDHDTRKDTTSQDSGISQMSLGNDIRNDVAALEERMEELTIRQNYTSTAAVNGVDSEMNGFNNIDDSSGEILVKKIIEHCQLDNPMDIAEKRAYLTKLAALIKKGQTEFVVENFRKLLRLLLENLSSTDTATLVLVLQIFTEIFNNPDMRQCWSNFIELLTLRVLSMHCNEKREVVKMAETTAAAMSVFPFTPLVCVLAPLIQTSTYPTILGAIKMLTKVVEIHPDDITDDHLAAIMPGLVKANDHEESPVRKSAVFCMVALHKVVGEERLAPYISGLAGSKLKLLRLYISRAQGSSVPTSPKNSANS